MKRPSGRTAGKSTAGWSSGWTWFGAWCIGWVLCLVAGGFVRHAGDPDSHPLLDLDRPLADHAATYNPGRFSFRSLAIWTALNDGDFRPVYDAARRVQDGEPMYRPEELREGRASFVYTPLTAALLAPLIAAGWSAERVADLVSVANHALALIGWLMLYRMIFAGRPRSWRTVLWFALPAIAFYPMARALFLTQCGIWIFFFSALSFAALSAGRAVLAGLALALAASIKPHLALCPLALLAFPGFPRAFIGAAVAGGLATAGVSIAYAGFDTIVAYLTDTLPQLSSGYSYFRNQSFNGLLLRGFTEQRGSVFDLARPVPWIRTTASVLGALVIVGVVLLRRRRAPGEPSTLDHLLAYAAVFAAIVVASPVCWIHHLILLLFPFGVGVRALLLRGRAGSAGAALLVGGLLMGTYFDAEDLAHGWPSWASNLEFAGALAVVATLALLRGTRPRSEGAGRGAGRIPGVEGVGS